MRSLLRNANSLYQSVLTKKVVKKMEEPSYNQMERNVFTVVKCLCLSLFRNDSAQMFHIVISSLNCVLKCLIILQYRKLCMFRKLYKTLFFYNILKQFPQLTNIQIERFKDCIKSVHTKFQQKQVIQESYNQIFIIN